MLHNVLPRTDLVFCRAHYIVDDKRHKHTNYKAGNPRRIHLVKYASHIHHNGRHKQTGISINVLLGIAKPSLLLGHQYG